MRCVTPFKPSHHIDFILRSRSRRTYLVAECKRADPSRARWCFARAPYTRHNPIQGEVIFDQFVYRPVNVMDQQPRMAYMDRGIHHVRLERKTDAPAEGLGQSSRAINFGGRSLECQALLERYARRELLGYTSTPILAEVLHRRMVAEAIAKGLVTARTAVRKLTKTPEVVKQLTQYQDDVSKNPPGLSPFSRSRWPLCRRASGSGRTKGC